MLFVLSNVCFCRYSTHCSCHGRPNGWPARDKAAVIGATIKARRCFTNKPKPMYVTQLHYTRFYFVTLNLPANKRLIFKQENFFWRMDLFPSPGQGWEGTS
jgi:hypothetical protein